MKRLKFGIMRVSKEPICPDLNNLNETYLNKNEIKFKTKSIRDAKKYHGVFVLVSNKEKDAFEALRKFRKREWIEDFFEEYKQRIGGKKHRVWDDLTFDGKKLIQFVALCYYEYFSRKIREMKGNLGVKNGEHNHDLKVNLDKEKALRNCYRIIFHFGLSSHSSASSKKS